MEIQNKIKILTEELVSLIVQLLTTNKLMRIDLPYDLDDITHVLWFAEDGSIYESPVKTISLCGEGIALHMQDVDTGLKGTLFSHGSTNPGLIHPAWLEKIKNNILSVLENKTGYVCETCGKLLEENAGYNKPFDYQYYCKDCFGKLHLEKTRSELEDLLDQAQQAIGAKQSVLSPILEKISHIHQDMQGSYPLLELHIDDIRNLGYNPYLMKMGDRQVFIRHIVKKIYSFHSGIDISAVIKEVASDTTFNLPELRTEIDYLYKRYVSENGIEPLYAQLWLRKKKSDSEIRKETVKLKVDISSCDGNLINKYFDGYKRLKEWLLSLNSDKMEADNWCYDDPGHTIIFSDKYIPTL